MTDDAKQRLRAHVEREQVIRLWGADYTITPRFVSEVFGDGAQLIRIVPLSTRSAFYVAAIDSAADMEDAIDDVLEAISGEFGERGRCSCTVEDETADGERHDEDCYMRAAFPVLNCDAGYTWGPYDWTDTGESSHAARRA